jgi:hypothetical protein
VISKFERWISKHRIIAIWLILWWLINSVRSQWLFNQRTNSTGGWSYCYTIYPGWQTWDSSGCLSCQEGMFYVDDQKHWVESCHNVIKDSTNSDQSDYFADTYARKCKRWGPDCTNWVDDIGWTSCQVENSVTDSTSIISVDSNDMQQCTQWSEAFANCNLWTSTECKSCSRALLAGGACTDPCDDSNCRSCSSDKAVWTHWDDGYVLVGAAWVSHACSVPNCNDCTTDPSTQCDVCKESYFSSSTTSCTSCLSNWLSCNDGTTCNLCQDGYMLTEDGASWVQSWAEDQYIEVTNLSILVRNLTVKRQCKSWEGTCEKWIGPNNSDCTKWALSKFLNVVDSSLVTGTWASKAAYPTTDKMYIYVSNSDTDIAKDPSLHLGTAAAPDIDLVKAIDRAKSMVAPYTTKSDGSKMIVHIVMYKGDHYLLKSNISPIIDNFDFYSANYELKISPMYCDLFSPSDTTNWYTNETDTLTVYNKLGSHLNIDIPMKLTMENIIWEMADGIIPVEDDVSNCLTTRTSCCVYNSDSKKLEKTDSSLYEVCTSRIILSDFCHRATKYNMMNFHPYHSNYGLTTPPELYLNSIQINDVFYEMNSIVDYNAGGHVTIVNSQFQRFSNWGSVVSNYNPQIVNSQTIDADYTKYFENFILRKNTISTDYDCTGATQWVKLSITNSTFINFSKMKTIPTKGILTNPDNGVAYRGIIAHLESFNGEVTLTGNNIEDVTTVISSCGIFCFSTVSTTLNLNIYGTYSTSIQTSLYYINNHERSFMIGDSIYQCTTSGSLVYIRQGNMLVDSTIIFYQTSIMNSGTYTNGGMIEVSVLVDSAFETTDKTALTTLLTSNPLMPCSGVALISTTLEKDISWAQASIPIRFKCRNSSGNNFIPALTNEEIAAITNNVISSYSFTFNSETITINRNYFNMEANSITNLLGVPNYPLFLIEGFLNFKSSNNIYLNNGQFIHLRIAQFTRLTNYHFQSLDR